jgi:hypothetical protein
MTSRISSVFIACLGIAMSGIAEEPKPPLPVPPFVASPPPNSTYTVTIKYSDEGEAVPDATKRPRTKPENDRPLSIQVWQDAKNRKIVVQHANGQKSEGYLFDSGFVIRSTANSNQTFVSSSNRGRDASLDIFTKDFPGTQWIDRSLYTGARKVEGQEYYSYFQTAGNPPPVSESEGSSPASGYNPIDHMELKALIRAADMMPSVVQLGPATYTFSPMQAWPGLITMPDNFKSSAESFTKEMSILEAFRKKNASQK